MVGQFQFTTAFVNRQGFEWIRYPAVHMWFHAGVQAGFGDGPR